MASFVMSIYWLPSSSPPPVSLLQLLHFSLTSFGNRLQEKPASASYASAKTRSTGIHDIHAHISFGVTRASEKLYDMHQQWGISVSFVSIVSLTYNNNRKRFEMRKGRRTIATHTYSDDKKKNKNYMKWKTFWPIQRQLKENKHKEFSQTFTVVCYHKKW